MELQQLIQRVRRKVQNNDRGEAYLLIAQAMNNDVLSQGFAEINREHRRIGHLPQNLYVARHRFYQELMYQARTHFGEEAFKQLYNVL